MQYLIRGNLALKKEFNDIDSQDDSVKFASLIDYQNPLLKMKSEGFLKDIGYQSTTQPEPEITPMDIEKRNLTLDDELFELPTEVEFVREQFVLCESNLMKLDSLLSRSNSRKLVDEFMRTLRYALLSTAALKGDQIAKIILQGGILKDTTNLSDPFSLDIELLIILRSESYSLAEIIFELADHIYGEILDKKRILFFCTILSHTEWKRIKTFENNECLILVEKERVL